jgi:hypothetical protein
MTSGVIEPSAEERARSSGCAEWGRTFDLGILGRNSGDRCRTQLRISIKGLSPQLRVEYPDLVILVLYGAGIGLLQYLLLRKVSDRAWMWIPANALGSFASGVCAASIVPWVSSSLHTFAPIPFSAAFFAGEIIAGNVFGYLTSIPLEFMAPPPAGR